MIIFYNIVFPETLSVENWIKAVVEIGLLLPVLEYWFIPGLCFLVNHLNHFRRFLVLLLPGELQDISTGYLFHLTRWKLQGLYHRVDEGVFRVLGRHHHLLFLFLSESDVLDGMFEDVIVGLGLGILHSADGAVYHGFWRGVSRVNRCGSSVLRVDNSGHQ